MGGKRMMTVGAILSMGANWVFSFGHSFWSFLIAWGVNG
jgi:OPA family glycerol-3-phosphate transporter-like MFS transporter/OPA family sugar phosphate sensor protein UhpC-like MFS transporter